MFEPQAWAAAFVEFFYGDCAPNLARPRNVGLRELFHYLATREELEYSLEADKDDPLIPGGCYRAPPQPAGTLQSSWPSSRMWFGRCAFYKPQSTCGKAQRPNGG